MAKQSIGSQLVAMRYAKMTAEERSDAARNAVTARWARTAVAREKAKAKKAGAKRAGKRAGREG